MCLLALLCNRIILIDFKGENIRVTFVLPRRTIKTGMVAIGHNYFAL